jgi:dipeptidase E
MKYYTHDKVFGMDRKIFLGGGGDAEQAKGIDDLYGETIGVGARVLYIPIAWTKSDQYDACLHWFRNAYARFDFEIEMLTDLNDVTIDYLHQFDSIYIGGGNTFALLKEIKATNFIKPLHEFINSGKAVYGGSAGALVLGKDIGTAFIGNLTDENIVQTTDFLGLNVANGYSIKAHYEDEKEMVEKFSIVNDTAVLNIPETGGVYIEGDTLTLVGNVTVIQKRKRN